MRTFFVVTAVSVVIVMQMILTVGMVKRMDALEKNISLLVLDVKLQTQLIEMETNLNKESIQGINRNLNHIGIFKGAK